MDKSVGTEKERWGYEVEDDEDDVSVDVADDADGNVNVEKLVVGG